MHATTLPFQTVSAALASLSPNFKSDNQHASTTHLFYEMERASAEAIYDRYSNFELPSSVTASRSDPSRPLIKAFGRRCIRQLLNVPPKYVVLYLASLRKDPEAIRTICNWYAMDKGPDLFNLFNEYCAERIYQTAAIRRQIFDARKLFQILPDDSIVLGRVNGEGLPQRISTSRVPYMILRDRMDPKNGTMQTTARFDDGTYEYLTDILVRIGQAGCTPPSGRENDTSDEVPPQTRTGMGGRPTAKALVMKVFEERAAAGQLQPTLKAEALAVAEIVASRLRAEDTKPTVGTIQNHLRRPYKQAMRSQNIRQI